MTRDELVTKHLAFAASFARPYLGTVDYDDARSAAFEGLVVAASRWAPELGVPFAGYAARRIKGSIGDELRADRRRHGRNRSGSVNVDLVSFDDEATAVDVPDETWASAAAITPTRIGRFFDRLKPRYRHIVHARYIDGTPVADIAAAMGVSGSAISHQFRLIERDLHDLYLAGVW